MRSTTSATLKPVESTTIASAAGFIGAIARAASRASRARWSASTASKLVGSFRAMIIGQPAASPFLLACRQVVFAKRIRENQSPLISTLGNHVLALGNLALPGRKPPPNTRAIGDEPGRLRDVSAADRFRDVFCSQIDLSGPDRHLKCSDEILERRFIRSDQCPREGPPA